MLKAQATKNCLTVAKDTWIKRREVDTMKVKDIIGKTVDNYMKIVVEVFDPDTNLIKERYPIEPHRANFTNIPEDVWETEVGMIILHFDSLVISVWERRA